MMRIERMAHRDDLPPVAMQTRESASPSVRGPSCPVTTRSCLSSSTVRRDGATVMIGKREKMLIITRQ